MSDDIDLVRLLEEIDAEYERRRIKRENPYVLHLIIVLLPRGHRGIRRVDAIEAVWNLRRSAEVTIPKEFVATVQSAYNSHCGQSAVFRKRQGKPEEALFFPVGGKGSGWWAVDRDKAVAWAVRKRLELDREP